MGSVLVAPCERCGKASPVPLLTEVYLAPWCTRQENDRNSQGMECLAQPDYIGSSYRTSLSRGQRHCNHKSATPDQPFNRTTCCDAAPSTIDHETAAAFKLTRTLPLRYHENRASVRVQKSGSHVAKQTEQRSLDGPDLGTATGSVPERALQIDLPKSCTQGQ